MISLTFANKEKPYSTLR